MGDPATVSASRSPRVIACAVLASCALLVACGQDPEVEPEVTVAPSTSAVPEYQPQEIAPITVSKTRAKTEDPGYHLAYELQGASYNPAGTGSLIHVLVYNTGDIAVPVDKFPPVHLVAGGVDAQQVEGGLPLDLPLGPGGATNLSFAFDAYYGNLYNASFSIGNVTFTGDLVS